MIGKGEELGYLREFQRDRHVKAVVLAINDPLFQGHEKFIKIDWGGFKTPYLKGLDRDRDWRYAYFNTLAILQAKNGAFGGVEGAGGAVSPDRNNPDALLLADSLVKGCKEVGIINPPGILSRIE